MKKIKLYDYQQKMLEDIINVLTSAATSTFYNENGKKEKVGSSVMVQMPTGTGKTYVMAAVVKGSLITMTRAKCGLWRTGVNWWNRCSRRSTDSAWTMGRRKWS